MNRIIWFAFEPPVKYPYAFTNINNYRWFIKNSNRFELGLLDCGVEIFWHQTEYPEGFLSMYKAVAKNLTQIFGERLWITIPDYCDDYKHVPNNVEKTLRNIKDFISINDVNWLPVVQSRYLDIFSYFESLEKTKEIIGDDYPRVAIGTVCKTRNIRFIVECCKATRNVFRKSWIHAFGLTLHALPKVKKFINSFDSSAYTFPRQRGHSCKNMRERIQYFNEFLQRVNKIIEVEK
ncbi:MAG: hypothetical protein QXQ20_08655 [Candidatus Nezhaarchaeales archaeon]